MKSLSLKVKLLALSLFLLSTALINGGVSYFSLKRVIGQYSIIAETNFPNTTSMLGMFANYRLTRIEALHLISAHSTPEEKNEAALHIEEAFKTDKILHDKYMAIEFLPGEAPLYEAFRKSIDKTQEILKKLIILHRSGKTDSDTITEMERLVFVEIKKAGNEGRVALEKLKQFHEEQAKIAITSAKESGSSSTTLIVAIFTVLGAFGLFLAYYFSTSLVKTLQGITTELDTSSGKLTSAAVQIAASSEELSQAATEQASSLEETSSSVQEMSSMVNINSENAKKAAENSAISKQQAEKGQSVVNDMVLAMEKINESNNSIMNQINYSNEQMQEIVTVIQEIGNKTKVINDIVFQTKLLSFNASVEAARAGEQGKGFAVVAEEVGNLAQMSGNAAKEISDMLTSSVQKVEAIVNETKSKVNQLIEDGKEKVLVGTKVAQECGSVLSEIVGNVTSVASMANEISNASDEQAKGIQEITKAMGQLDQVTQTNAASSHQAASSAEDLSSQALTLKNQVVSLIAVINGEKNSNVTNDYIPKTPKQEKKQVITKEVAKPIKKKEEIAPKPVEKADNIVDIKKTSSTTNRDNVPRHDHPGFEEV